MSTFNIFPEEEKVFYTLYNKIDLMRSDGKKVVNLYSSSPHYVANIIKDSAKLSIKNFATKYIHIEDRELFEKFLDITTLESRINESGDRYITSYFRTRNEQDKFVWQLYLLMPVLHNGEKYFICCLQNIDSAQLNNLPEIDIKGTAYYIMPSNPIFLMLASRSFTSILGYGSFEKFLHSSFYLEVNLTTNKILYMHLGKPGMVRTKLNYKLTDYTKLVQDIVLNSVIDESQTEMQNFFNRDRLLKEFKEGKLFSEQEFLRSADADENPRWLHTSYQIRESTDTDEIHAFFLVFDIDSYRRTNEAILNLIERDALTGLYNRRTALTFIENILEQENLFAFIILDLDNFKQINDRFGHDCGDKIIKDAAMRMTKHFDNNGFVARIGGDEFLVILKNLSPAEIDERLKKFSITSKFIRYKNQQVNYTMSIGYSLYPEQGENYRELYQNADAALYSVKMKGRNSYKKFSRKMIADNRTQLGVSLSQISEGMPGGFLLYRDNENLEIIYANTRLWEIYECNSLEEFRKFTGNSFKGCVHPDDFDKVQKTIYKQVGVSKGYDYVRYKIITAKGNVKIIEDFGRLVHSSNGEDIFYVFMIDFSAKEQLWKFVTSSEKQHWN